MGGMSSFSDSIGKYNWDNSAAGKRAKDYAKQDNRTYTQPKLGLAPPVGTEIKSKSKYPEILLLDVTGSMRHLPRFILERVPTLYNEVNAAIQGYSPDELKKNPVIPNELELSIIAVGDATCDRYPIQVLDFESGGLTKAIEKIYPEGGGGGQAMESYELAAYYVLNHSETPDSLIKPICIIAGDEAFYDLVRSRQVKMLIGDDLKENLDARDVIEKLSQKYDTYILRPELQYSKEIYKEIHKKWADVLGEERVMKMPDPEAIVNSMILVSGIAADNYDDAIKMLERREEKWEIDQAIETIHPLLGKKTKKGKK